MNKEIEISYKISDVITQNSKKEYDNAKSAYDKLINSNMEMTGWVDYPANISEDLINQINQMADIVRTKFTALVIVGIGGSYLGAKAAFDFLVEDQETLSPRIFFAGMNLSSDYHEKILKKIENEDTALLIISKSGGTTETLVASNIFMEYLEKKYGAEGKKERIFIVTDPDNGKLRKVVDDKGYPSLPIPANIGGRFSVLTPVGLLPMATSGIDIYKVLEGAKSASSKSMIDKAIKLASSRYQIESGGYAVELFAGFDPYLDSFIQWIKQLYGESEGKEGKGMLPVNLEYTRDLHSLGQFVQEGRQTFSETLLSVNHNTGTINIPASWGFADKDISLSELNNIARTGVIAAHNSAGVPVIEIQLPKRDECAFGQAVYFFQLTCAVKGIMMGIDPFNQPGVGKYKEEMSKGLKLT